jgi:hypothetical protein
MLSWSQQDIDPEQHAMRKRWREIACFSLALSLQSGCTEGQKPSPLKRFDAAASEPAEPVKSKTPESPAPVLEKSK